MSEGCTLKTPARYVKKAQCTSAWKTDTGCAFKQRRTSFEVIGVREVRRGFVSGGYGIEVTTLLRHQGSWHQESPEDLWGSFDLL